MNISRPSLTPSLTQQFLYCSEWDHIGMVVECPKGNLHFMEAIPDGGRRCVFFCLSLCVYVYVYVYRVCACVRVFARDIELHMHVGFVHV